jgi:hypothetical protein
LSGLGHPHRSHRDYQYDTKMAAPYRKWSDLNLTRTLAAALVIIALAGIINALHGLGVF